MKYYNKLIFEISEENRIGYNLEKKNLPKVELPKALKRSQKEYKGPPFREGDSRYF